MLYIVVRVVSFIGIPFSSEEVSLPGNGATLHMHAVDEAVFNVGSAPVSAPDKAATLRQVSHEREIAFKGRLPTHHADDVTSQPVVMVAHRPKFGRSVIEEHLLAILTAVGFVDHEFDTH